MLAHDAKFGARIEIEFLLTVAIADQVATIAEKDEAAVNEPAKQIAHFDQFAIRRGFLADLKSARAHVREVSGRLADLGQNRYQLALDLPRLVRRWSEFELGVDERFAALGGV
jgi:hypothetical protein